MLRQQFLRDKWLLQHDEPKDFSCAWFQITRNIHPAFIVYRTIMMIYLLGTFVYIVLWWPRQDSLLSGDKPKLIIYVTFWTYIIQTITFFWGFLVIVVDFVKQCRGTDPELSVLTKIFWVLYTVTLPAAFTVSWMYWCFVYDHKKDPDLEAAEILMHVMNSFVIFMDFCIVAFPYRCYHFYMILIYVVLYIIFSVIYELAGGTGAKGERPIYKVLDWKHESAKAAAVCVVGILIALSTHFQFGFMYVIKLCMIKYLVKEPAD